MDSKPVNKESPEKPEIQIWGSGLDVVSFSSDEPTSNQLEVQLNIPQNSTAAAENDGSNLEIIPKYLQKVARYSFGFLLGVFCLVFVIICLLLLYKIANGYSYNLMYSA